MTDNDFGPLPQSDRSDDLQEESFRAFSAVFPPADFRVRSELGKDTGSDRYLEVKVSGRDTNLRSQVQLKGVDKAAPNQDGTISKSIDTSNLNYLLNGPSPMYVLYVGETRILYFAWARDVANTLETSNPRWKEAQTITIRFDKILDQSRLAEIRNRTIQDERLSRRIHENLLRASRSEAAKFAIDPSGVTMDGAEAAKILEESGATLVGSGFPNKAVELFELLQSKQKQHKRILLIMSYAHFMMGRYDLASGYLRECFLVEGNLSDADSWLFDELKNGCDYNLGRKSEAEFRAAELEVAQRSRGSLAEYIGLEELRQRYAGTRKGPESQAILEEMEVKFRRIKDAKDSSEVLKMSSEGILLYAQGHDTVTAVFQNISEQRIQSESSIAGMAPASSESPQILLAWQEWHRKAAEFIDRAIELKHPILIGDSHYTRAAIVTLFLINIQMFSEIGWIERPDYFSTFCQDAQSDIDCAVKVFNLAGCLEAKIRAQLILADLLEVSGEVEKSADLGREAMRNAGIMGYERLAAQATEIVNGNSHLTRLRNGMMQQGGRRQR